MNNSKAIIANLKKLNANLSKSTNLTTQVLDEFESETNTLYNMVDDNDEIVELGFHLTKK